MLRRPEVGAGPPSNERGLGGKDGQCGIRRMDAAAGRVARVHRATVAVVTVERRPTGAGTGLTDIRSRAEVAVATGRPVRLLRVRAEAGGRVAGAHVVALVESGADDRVGARAGPRLAGVGLRAGIRVIAGRPVRLRRVRAGSR